MQKLQGARGAISNVTQALRTATSSHTTDKQQTALSRSTSASKASLIRGRVRKGGCYVTLAQRDEKTGASFVCRPVLAI
ncbi:hypothetical protein C8035_v000096 [Colletotrichum spinosum]|uniref:Uncharacterized protein n=1 Tax=Colletotrichum spinosum TaxID=1347390 RepID=A0A4R8PPT2_9PEZI|nr:hypothetical protein C8035_v000096 [Colletotrichum spinosum]